MGERGGRFIQIGLVLIVAAGLVGCGSTSLRDRSLRDWDKRQGYAWSAYVNGYRHGWTAGCRHGEDPDACSYHQAGVEPYEGDTLEKPGNRVNSEVPWFPPKDAWGQGYTDGWEAACYGVAAASESPLADSCPKEPNPFNIRRPRRYT
jgi:hypothetical protein